jgi:hypothetical protein
MARIDKATVIVGLMALSLLIWIAVGGGGRDYSSQSQQILTIVFGDESGAKGYIMVPIAMGITPTVNADSYMLEVSDTTIQGYIFKNWGIIWTLSRHQGDSSGR